MLASNQNVQPTPAKGNVHHRCILIISVAAHLTLLNQALFLIAISRFTEPNISLCAHARRTSLCKLPRPDGNVHCLNYKCCRFYISSLHDLELLSVAHFTPIANFKFLTLNIYIIPRALHEALFLIAISESRSRFTEPNNSLCAHASVQPVCTLSTCPSLTAMYTVLIISAAVHNTPYTEHF